MKKFCFYVLIVGTALISAQTIFAADVGTEAFKDTNYQLLQPLPDSAGDDVKVQSIDVTNLAGYINTMFLIVIGLAAVLAVLYITYGGIIYMSTDAITGKKEGKEKIKQALWGLVIILGCFLILQTINPTILNLTALNKDAEALKLPNSGTSGGTGTSTDSGAKKDYCYNILIQGYPYLTNVCGFDTISRCQEVAMANQQNLKYSTSACQTSSAPLLKDKNFCFEISVNGTHIKEDCSTGAAYMINPQTQKDCAWKENDYKKKGYNVGAGCYIEGNLYCVNATKPGEQRVPDCTAGTAYIQNPTQLNTCNSKASYVNGTSVKDEFYGSSCFLKK